MDVEKNEIEDFLATFRSVMSEQTRDKVLIIIECIKYSLNSEPVCGKLHDVNTTAVHLSEALGTVLEWRKWVPEIPFIQFDADMCVKMLPPDRGAMVRFLVSNKGGTSGVSVYLDCHKVLGISPPYWEIYPVEEEASRVDIDDVEGLLEKIRIGLKDTVVGD